jgi:hypothetical protein
MLLVKIRNAAELGWESLDSQERMLVVYAGAWVVLMLCLRARQVGRERLKAELREELAGART